MNKLKKSILAGLVSIMVLVALSFPSVQVFAASPASLQPSPISVSAHVKKVYPPGVTAVCKDGTYSYSQYRRGTCSRHHGVKIWVKRLPK